MDNYFNEMFKNIDNSIVLDKEQIEIIKDKSDVCLVVAGAGTGKTTTITAKVKYLVDIKKINPKEILVISFTNKAVDELKERINLSFNIPCEIYTFHKLGIKIINNKRIKYNIDSNMVLKNLIKKYKYNEVEKIIKKDKIYKKNCKNKEKFFIDFSLANINLYRLIDTNKVEYNKKFEKYYVFLKNIISSYENYMKENNNYDFSYIIKEAINNINNYKVNYKYIIVDEFQDISYDRLTFLNSLVKKNNSKLFVVGDDWQSIYSFAGSNINNFYNIINNKTKVFKITKTYRNSNQLIDIAGKFIMNDKKLLEKNLSSYKNLKFPVKLHYTKNNYSLTLYKIVNDLYKRYPNKTILILGRYKNDIEPFLSDYIKIKNKDLIFKKVNCKVKYMTIHSSKGLGYDNVILLNLEIDKRNKFPSTKKNDFFLKSIYLSNNNVDEERRLFYVAMTRTKNEFHIILKKNKESSFIKEIKHNI